MYSRKFLGILAAVLLLAPATADAFDGNRKGFLLGFGVGSGMASYTQDVSLTFPLPFRLDETLLFPEQDIPDRTYGRDTKTVISTNLKLGWGLTEQLLVYYIAQVAWFNHSDVFMYDDPTTSDKEFYWVFDGLDGLVITDDEPPDTIGIHFSAPKKEVWIATGLLGLGVSYYLGPTSPFYVMGAAGVSTWTAPFEDDDWLSPYKSKAQTWFGYGALAGFGWEFMKHWCLEATAMWGAPGEEGSLLSGGTEYDVKVTSNVASFTVMVTGIAY